MIVRMQHVAPSQPKQVRLNDNVPQSHEGQRNSLVPLLMLTDALQLTGTLLQLNIHVHHSCGSVQIN